LTAEEGQSYATFCLYQQYLLNIMFFYFIYLNLLVYLTYSDIASTIFTYKFDEEVALRIKCKIFYIY